MRRLARRRRTRRARRRLAVVVLAVVTCLSACASVWLLGSAPLRARSAVGVAPFAAPALQGRVATGPPRQGVADRNAVMPQLDNVAWGSGHQFPYAADRRVFSDPVELRAASAAAVGCLVVGDSLAGETAWYVGERLRARFGAACGRDAWAGRRTQGTANALLDIAVHEGIPGTVVVMSGANDIFNPPAFEAEARRLLTIVGPAHRVLWVTPYASRRPWGPFSAADERNSAYVAAVLARLAPEFAHLRLVPWNARFVGHPDEVTRLLRDGVHPNEAGRAVLLDAITQAWVADAQP